MILVAGGAGYVGAHVNKRLSQRGFDTVVLDNLTRGHRSFVKWGSFIHGDLADREQLTSCFRSYPIDSVMHLGAFAYVGESVTDPAGYYRNNVANTLNLLDAMREFGVPHLVFSSTCSTYGLPQHSPITEDHPQAPVNPYGWSKFMIEQILKDYDSAYGIKHVNLRYFNAAGADEDAEVGEQHDPETHLIPLVLDVAAGKRPYVKIFGADYETADGTCIRDYIHVTDLADAHILALDHLRSNGSSASFNLANGNGFSVYDVVRTVEQVTGRAIRCVVADRRSGDPPVLIGNSGKARDVLRWHPRFVDLTAIIATAWRWHQKSQQVS